MSTRVRDSMVEVPHTVGPDHTVREAARMMAHRRVGAAIVVDPEQPSPGIMTERDVLRMVAAGGSANSETVADHHTDMPVSADADWSLDHAAAAMIDGGFRHLVVVAGGDLLGVLAMRDVVRTWVEGGQLGLDVSVGDVVHGEVVTASADATLREAARRMAEREVGAVVVTGAEGGPPGILTEYDLSQAVADGRDLDSAQVADHFTAEAVSATPDWSLGQAAEAMAGGGFRHLVVVEDGDPIGVLSVRDVVRHAVEAHGAGSSG